ncbi:MAG: Crp/Fnr family transcriptional regulator [Rhizomicrobium sp.]
MPSPSLADRNETTPPVNCRNCALGRNTLYGYVATHTPDVLNACRREVRNLPAGRSFTRDGEIQSRVWTLYAGWAYRYSTLSDGRRHIHYFHLPGDILVMESLLLPGIRLPFAVRSLTAVTLCAFDTAEAAAMVRSSPGQQNQAALGWQQQMADLHRHLSDIGRRSAMGRISQLLLEIERRLSARQLADGGRFAFPVNQEQIADALGLTTVYVNRTLDKLRQMEVIAFDRRHMHILQPGRLAEIAEEE